MTSADDEIVRRVVPMPCIKLGKAVTEDKDITAEKIMSDDQDEIEATNDAGLYVLPDGDALSPNPDDAVSCSLAVRRVTRDKGCDTSYLALGRAARSEEFVPSAGSLALGRVVHSEESVERVSLGRMKN